MEYLFKRWYICAFGAVSFFAAGTMMDIGGEGIGGLMLGICDGEGWLMLRLALMVCLMAAAMYLFTVVIRDGFISRILTAAVVWLKCLFMGLFCREVLCEPRIIYILICLLDVFGGGLICFSLMLRHESQGGDMKYKRTKLSLWASGVLIEAVILPSLMRTASLIISQSI